MMTAAQNPSSPEISTEERQPEFVIQSRRNTVLVRVVVRDANGHEVGTLKQDDFTIFDNGKPQAITHFSVERPATAPVAAPAPPIEKPGEEPAPEGGAVAPAAHPVVLPQHFLALFFDDVHLAFGDLAQVRDAASRYLNTALKPEDRAGIFTSSGQGILDFTPDREKLQAALLQLKPRPISGDTNPCPDLSDYEAYLIDQGDTNALAAATLETVDCLCQGDAAHCPFPQQYAASKARAVSEQSVVQSQYTIRGLEGLIRRLQSVPGQRAIVLVSSGFMSVTLHFETSTVVDQALRANVVISALDARGLDATPLLGDASQTGSVDPQAAGLVSQMRLEGRQADSDFMASVAEGTGGKFFHNNNDLDRGWRETGQLPEVYYVLAFTPADLKYDGKFHQLKVKLANPARLTLTARRGYFAPQKLLDPKEQAEQEIQDTVFAQQEMKEIPIDVRTQFFKPDNLNAKLTVVTHLDARAIHFRKEQDRNADDVVVAVALFDGSGNFVEGKQSTLHLRLRDETLQHVLQSGLGAEINFDVKPGTYLLRTVVRDSGNEEMSALNNSVEIPY